MAAAPRAAAAVAVAMDELESRIAGREGKKWAGKAGSWKLEAGSWKRNADHPTDESPRARERVRGLSQGCRRWPTLPRSLDRSTIGAVGLNDRVRDGNGCGPYALIASDRTVGPSDGPTEQKGRKRMGDSREMDRLGAVRRSEARQWVICR